MTDTRVGHTPGPWLTESPQWPGAPFVRIFDRLRLEVARVDRVDHSADESDANARLFAAAPDLLASAREAYKYSAFHQSDCRGVASYAEGEISDPTIGCDCYLARLKAAIAKAEGNQS